MQDTVSDICKWPLTQVLLAQFQQGVIGEAQASAEAVRGVASDKHFELIAKFHKFELLDELFGSFMSTNRNKGKCYLLEELLGVKYPKEFKFVCMTIPYVATVFTHDGADEDWVNIKLPNNGFVYTAKEGEQLSRHKSKGWVKLPEAKFFPYMAETIALLKPLYKRVVAFYNFGLQRFDLKFYPANDSGANVPHLIVTYEPGYPDYEDQAEGIPLSKH